VHVDVYRDELLLRAGGQSRAVLGRYDGDDENDEQRTHDDLRAIQLPFSRDVRSLRRLVEIIGPLSLRPQPSGTG
jgi:hypothetical protein